VLLVEDDGREVKRGKSRLWIKGRQEKGKGCPYFSWPALRTVVKNSRLSQKIREELYE